MIDLDTLIARQPKPWQINVPPPRDRYFEVMYMGTRLICLYSPRDEAWTIGTDLHLQRHEITHWRDLSEHQLDQLNDVLAGNPAE
jgi:hypothetical protein